MTRGPGRHSGRNFWGGLLSPSLCLLVCLSVVRSIAQKRTIQKRSNLVQGMTLGYPASGMIFGLLLLLLLLL